MLLALARSARPVAPLRGRARDGPLSQRRCSNRRRRIGTLGREESGVDIALVDEIFGFVGVEIKHGVYKVIDVFIIDGGSDDLLLRKVNANPSGYMMWEWIAKTNVRYKRWVKQNWIAGAWRIIGRVEDWIAFAD